MIFGVDVNVLDNFFLFNIAFAAMDGGGGVDVNDLDNFFLFNIAFAAMDGGGGDDFATRSF